MKIIVVSIAPWNRGNNFGKTFCDIFEGMENVEFLNIYCDSGLPDNNVKAKYYQITVNDIIANLLHKNKKVGSKPQIVQNNCTKFYLLTSILVRILRKARNFKFGFLLIARKNNG